MPKVIFWAFLLNTIWEFTQCLFFMRCGVGDSGKQLFGCGGQYLEIY